MAGDTDEGRFVSSGLYRKLGDGAWRRVDSGFAEPPEIRAILCDPRNPDRVMVGAQNGIFASEDRGESWRALPARKPELAVWSLHRQRSDPAVIFAGYEPAALYRSADDGETWTCVDLAETFPHITTGPGMPKRITGIATGGDAGGDIYLSLEIGGLLRSLDGGRSWEAAIDGLYVVEDAVDLHGVVLNPERRNVVTVTTRVGTFRSDDSGRHWRKLPIPPLRSQGSYCRAIAYAPASAETLYLGAGNDFDGDKGALFISRDDGESWAAADLPGPLKSTVFAVAVHPSAPRHVHCATKNGGVFSSRNAGSSWTYSPLPRGCGHVFALAVA